MKETKKPTPEAPRIPALPNGRLQGLLRHIHWPLESNKQIRYFDMKELGYVSSCRKVILLCGATGGGSHELFELLDADSGKPSTFCFLYSYAVQMGIIVRVPFAVAMDEIGA